MLKEKAVMMEMLDETYVHNYHHNVLMVECFERLSCIKLQGPKGFKGVTGDRGDTGLDVRMSDYLCCLLCVPVFKDSRSLHVMHHVIPKWAEVKPPDYLMR